MCLADRTDLLVDEHGLVNHMRDSGELADGLVFLIAQQVVELRIDLLQIIGDLGDGLFQCHLCHDAADAGEHGGVELPWLGELQMFDDAPVRLPYNTGLERSLLTVLAVFGDQLSRFLGEFYPTSAFDHGVAGCLCAFAGRGDGLYGFGCECFGIEPSSLSQRSMVPASPRKTMPCSSWMMVTLFVSSGLLFPVLASASPSPPSNGMSSLESSSIMVISFKSTW